MFKKAIEAEPCLPVHANRNCNKRWKPWALLSTVFLSVACTEAPDPAEESAEAEIVTTGDFRLRSYRKVEHPRYRATVARLESVNVVQCDPVTDGKIYRFVAGADSCLTVLSETEIEKNLNDEFATGVLRENVFPTSVDEILAAVKSAYPSHTRVSYMVGEGGQVPTSIASRSAERNLRYVVVWGPDATTGRIFLSAAPGGHSSFLQVISWNDTNKKFDYFEHRTQVGDQSESPIKVWSWAGESAMAREPATTGKGCFDCHHNGVVIMKELTTPWNNWNSEVANIPAEHVPLAVAKEALFQNLKGAQGLQTTVQNGAQAYYRSWLEARYQRGNPTQLKDVNEMLRHLVSNSTVNFASGEQQTRTPSQGAELTISGVPNDALLWDSVFSTVLSFNYSVPTFEYQRTDFRQFLADHKFELEQTDSTPGYTEPGSTFFFYFVPVPAFEDRYMISQLLSAKVVTRKFVAAVLMVDFSQPVFSNKRSSLQTYAATIKTGTISNGVSSVPTDFAAAVSAGAEGQSPCDHTNLQLCSAEQQFLYYWGIAEDSWQSEMEGRIQAYLDSIGNLSPEQQMDSLMKLGARRRHSFETWPVISNLNEFSLLIPKNNLLQP